MTASPPEPAPGVTAPLSARIRAALRPGDDPRLVDAQHGLRLRDLATGALIDAAQADLHGRNVLIRTDRALAAAAALASLDGVAARLVLCPPDLDASQLAAVAAAAKIEVVVADAGRAQDLPGLVHHDILTAASVRREAAPSPALATQWGLFTSGTSGAPKLVGHSLAALTGAIQPLRPDQPLPIWATFYDGRRYGGLQMLLRALVGGFDLLITDPEEPIGAFLTRLRTSGVTHIAGTPSHWRRALMSPELQGLEPQYVRLSGEIADQPVLDSLRLRFPQARIGHAYASTEAGVGFEVSDGRAGFPPALIEHTEGAVQIRVVDGALHLRSARAAQGYIGAGAGPISDADGWVDTGDLVEQRDERFYFLGRRSGVINVGGLKISPEEVEAVINACPGVRMSRVSGRASPVLGALVSAEVILAEDADATQVRAAILAHCRAALPAHKVPASLKIVAALPVGASGKLERRVA